MVSYFLTLVHLLSSYYTQYICLIGAIWRSIRFFVSQLIAERVLFVYCRFSTELRASYRAAHHHSRS